MPCSQAMYYVYKILRLLHSKQIMNKFVAPPTDNEMC